MKNLILISVLICIYANLFSQDIIIKNDKTEIQAKVVEITSDFIKYKSYSNLDGPLRNISVSNVFMILYENGEREIMNVEETKISTTKEEPKKEVYSSGSNPNNYITPIKTKKQKPDFVFGINLQGYAPFDDDFSQIYNSLFGGDVSLGVFFDKFGFETSLGYLYGEGDPIEKGNVDDSRSKIGFTRFFVSGYFAPKHSKVRPYIGGGFGVVSICETLQMQVFHQNKEISASAMWFDLHIGGGIKINHLNLGVNFSSLTSSEFESNFGGATFEVGLCF